MLLILFASFLASADVRVEVAVEEGLARVYEVREEPGQLPELIRVRSFPTLAEARFAAAQIPSTDWTEKSLRAPLPTEAGFLWNAQESWSWDWELKYAHWIQNEVDEHFFKNHNIATDCADVAVGLRWIFSRMHGLPAAFHLLGSGQLFSQDTVNEGWRSLPQAAQWNQDQRFLASLRYILRLTFTHSLFRDSYPVEINPQTFLAGIHHLNLHDRSGHTQVVARVDTRDDAITPLETIASTVPSEVRVLMRGEFLVFGAADRARSALMRIRWPQKNAQGAWELLPEEAHPSFSLQQFAPDFLKEGESFVDAVLKLLNPNLDYLKRLNSLLNTIFDLLKARVQIVENGFRACQQEDCRSGTPAYEEWSTPSRDLRVLEAIQAAETLAQRQSVYRPQIRERWQNSKKETVAQVLGRDLTFEFLTFVWRESWVETDPRASVAERWGLDAERIATKASYQLDQLLQTRQGLIENAEVACAPPHDCSTGSTLWSQLVTSAPEKSLRATVETLSHYQRLIPTVDQRTLNAWLEKRKFSAGPHSLTYPELLDRMPWFNLEPFEPAPVRWGSRKDQFKSVRIPVLTNDIVQVSRSGVAMVTAKAAVNSPISPAASMPISQDWITTESRTVRSVIDLERNTPVEAPTGKQWLTYSGEEDVGVAFATLGSAFEIDFVSRDGTLLFRDSVAGLEEMRFRWLTDQVLVRGRRVPGPLPMGDRTPWVDIYTVSKKSVSVVRNVSFSDPPDAPGFTKRAWVAADGTLYRVTDQGVVGLSVPDWLESQAQLPLECSEQLLTCVGYLSRKTGEGPMDFSLQIFRVSTIDGKVEPLSEIRPVQQASWMGAPGAPLLTEVSFNVGPPQVRIHEWSNQGPLQLRDQGTMYGWYNNTSDRTNYVIQRSPQEFSLWAFERGQNPRNATFPSQGNNMFSLNSRFVTFLESGADARCSFHRLEQGLPVLLTSPPGASCMVRANPVSPAEMRLPQGQGADLLYDWDYSAQFPLFTLPPRSTADFELQSSVQDLSIGKVLRGKLGPTLGTSILWYEPVSERFW